MAQPNDIKTDVELLKKDFEQLSALIDRMDLMIEKLSEVSTGLNRILAVHDNRLSQQEEITKHIFELIEMRRRESVESTKELKDMFDKVTAELKKGIDNLEKWRYYLIGMAIASGFLLSKLPDIRALLS
jgi:hypothetical protein